jgi:protease II
MLLCIGTAALLVPPVPPIGTTRVAYGADTTSKQPKGSESSKLLSPAVQLHDPLFELRDRQNPATMAHIRAENEYLEASLQQDSDWRKAVHDMLHSLERHAPPRAAADDSSLLWHRGCDTGGWEYAWRTPAGKPFPQFVRRRKANGADEAPQLLLDANAAPALMRSEYDAGRSFMGTVRGVSAFVPSPSGELAAYTVDTTGEERFSMMVARLPSGGAGQGVSADEAAAAASPPLHAVSDVDVDVCWGSRADELFYVTMDATGRPYRLHRLDLGLAAEPETTTSAAAMPSKGKGSSSGGGGGGGFGGDGGDGFGPAASAPSKRKRKERSATRPQATRIREPVVGAAATAGRPPRSVLVFEELDPRYRLSIRTSADGSRLLVELRSRDASETWALSLTDPPKPPSSASSPPSSAKGRNALGWRCLGERTAGLQYEAEFWADAPAREPPAAASSAGQYVIVEASAGALHTLTAADAERGQGRASWQRVEARILAAANRGSADAPTLLALQCFASFVAIECRMDGASALLLWDGGADEKTSWTQIDGKEVCRLEPSAGTLCRSLVGVGDGGGTAAAAALESLGLEPSGQWSLQLAPSHEQSYLDGGVRLEFSTPLDPPRILELTPTKNGGADCDDAQPLLRTLWAQESPAGFEPADFACGRVWARADDGVHVPISVLMRVGSNRAAGAASVATPMPALLSGYGSYGVCTDPGWDPERLALASSGVLTAIAHVRGGGERGAGWHAAGRREQKPTSFTDLAACAGELVDRGLAYRGAVALEGRSAGGLLVGACTNLDPSRYCALLASVPFLDAAGTLQDSSLPLTANEWEEFVRCLPPSLPPSLPPHRYRSEPQRDVRLTLTRAGQSQRSGRPRQRPQLFPRPQRTVRRRLSTVPAAARTE